MLTIIDYEMGNLRNVYMAFRRLGVEPRVTSDPREIREAEALVLPGVGAFGDAIDTIRRMGLEEAILEAIDEDRPFLGICVGLQLLFELSEEMGEHRGLGVLPGRVRRFPRDLTVPHMGWNQIHQAKDVPLWRGLPDGSYAYFVHSYYVDPEEKELIAARTDYGKDEAGKYVHPPIVYTSAIARDNLYAIQFHPEKSQNVGERILRNFSVQAGLLGENT
ncbi:MAG: imidazole glycerol phosphate synthase subunit HisH [Chloroflexota bacterium]|nr:imidazole glycerol phosphate synthase subunit HisH [Chloroflexota bacterium]